MRISVVIPCYNSADFIGETLTSVLAQQRQADEIIVADDCSTDNSAEVAAGFPGVTVVNARQNAGCAASRNLAIQHSTGDVIAILDSDDLWEPHHLRVAEEALTKFPEAGFTFSDITRFGSATHPSVTDLPAGTPLDIFEPLLLGNLLNQPTVVFRRTLYQQTTGFDTSIRYCEDYDLWLQFAIRSRVVFTGESTARYRMHDGQLSKHHPAMFRDTWYARWHALETVETLGDAERIGQARNGLRQAWRNGLYTAWAFRSRESLDFMLAMADRFPDEVETLRIWQRRRSLWPWLMAADRISMALPGRIRQAIKPRWGSSLPRI